ncbi:cation diffusion facilitator family transporter [Kroppenstedtia guangzhouensis]|nr:cation diffusion facilitator family transporter [Kroppenstedtia guangzhouensis]
MGFTWSDFGSSEQRKGHVKPNPDHLASTHSHGFQGISRSCLI